MTGTTAHVPTSPRPAMTTLRHSRMDSPVGPLLLVARDGALVGVHFTDDRDDVPDHVDLGRRDDVALAPVRRQLTEYFAGARQVFDMDLAPEGTVFQRRVWDQLRRIPWGETRSYMDIARAVGGPGAVRAVGTANGSNPIAIIVPCHRVIGSDGSLVGYAGGLDRKRHLLDLEAGIDTLFDV